MLLLLAGSTETARSMIIDDFLGGHANWKHLALEDVEDTGEGDEDVLGVKQTFMTMVACDCAKEAQKQGHPIVITCPSNEMIETVFDEFGTTVVTVYLGAEEDAENFDFVIDTKISVDDSCKLLSEIVQCTPA